MNLDAPFSEVRALPADARRKLMALLVSLQDEGRAGYAAKLAQKIDDPSPDRWLTAEQCEQKPGLNGDAK